MKCYCSDGGGMCSFCRGALANRPDPCELEHRSAQANVARLKNELKEAEARLAVAKDPWLGLQPGQARVGADGRVYGVDHAAQRTVLTLAEI